jgi:sulfur-oxidizing protein SoxX
MPAYFKTEHLNRVAPKFAGQTILNGQEIEDVVAFLVSLNK